MKKIIFLLALTLSYFTGRSQASPVKVTNTPLPVSVTGGTFTPSGTTTVTPAAGSTFSTSGNSTVTPKAGSIFTISPTSGTTFSTSGNSTVTPEAGSTFTFTPSGSSVFPITFPSGALTVSTPTNATGAGTVATGARSVLFQTSSNFVGTINTTSYSASSNISYGAIMSYTYPAISYSVTTGTLTISAIR